MSSFLAYFKSEPCPICTHGLDKEVRILPCGHSLHTQCLDDLLNLSESERRIRCPLCRKRLKVKDIRSAADFTRNYAEEPIVEQQQQRAKTSQSSGASNRAARSAGETAANGTDDGGRRRCKAHKNDAAQYCVDCDCESVCGQCLREVHKGHDTHIYGQFNAASKHQSQDDCNGSSPPYAESNTSSAMSRVARYCADYWRDWKLFTPKAGQTEPNALVCLGGAQSGHCMKSVELLDTDRNEWMTLPEMMLNRRAAAAVAVNNRIYVVGGSDGKRYHDECEYLDMEGCSSPKSWQWQSLARLNYERASLSLVSVGEQLYAVGGWNGAVTFRDLERCDTTQRKKQWTVLGAEAAMSKPRRGHACVAKGGGKIFIIGGFDGKERLADCEVFDVASQQCYPIAPLTTKRNGVCASVCNNQIFVFGGHDGKKFLDSAEQYNESVAKWIVVKTQMDVARNFFAVALLPGTLFLVGGNSKDGYLKTASKYDMTHKQWSAMASMSCPRNCPAAAVCTVKPRTATGQ